MEWLKNRPGSENRKQIGCSVCRRFGKKCLVRQHLHLRCLHGRFLEKTELLIGRTDFGFQCSQDQMQKGGNLCAHIYMTAVLTDCSPLIFMPTKIKISMTFAARHIISLTCGVGYRPGHIAVFHQRQSFFGQKSAVPDGAAAEAAGFIIFK